MGLQLSKETELLGVVPDSRHFWNMISMKNEKAEVVLKIAERIFRRVCAGLLLGRY